MKFLDLQSQYQSIKGEIDEAIQKVLNKGVFIGGEEVKKLEKDIADFCNVKYAIGVNSGTDALFLALKALGIGEGDEVITTPFTFIATAEVIVNLGAKPVFVDINPKTFNIDVDKIEEKITSKTKVILPVHLFGQSAEMDKIMELAEKYNLKVIEDAAQAIGAKYKEKRIGGIGDIGCFSFYPTKNLGAYGDGGMIVTDNEEIYSKIKLLKNHGSSKKDKYLNLVSGYNSRLDTIQAAILNVKFKYLEEWTEQRIKNAEYYNEQLKDVEGITTPYCESYNYHVYNQYVIRGEKRDELKDYLKNNDIPTEIYYSLPLHLQPAFEFLSYKKGDLIESEKASREVLSLPIYSELKREYQNLIIKKIKEFYE
jgi:dTDP-4-amino-4,6-dideoxygalactose transaminase